MGREIRRVPLDFNWPLNKIWEGFLSPDTLDGEKCPDCNGSGQTHFGWWLQHFSYLMGMLAEDVRAQENGKPMHPWLREFPHPHGHFEYPVKDDPKSGPGRFIIDRPSTDAVDFFAALMGVPPEKITGSFFGGQPNYAVMQKLMEVTGMDVSCKACDGHGSTEKYPGQRADAEAWEPTDPPKGDGWQLWETASEGSPISPVFATADELAAWMSDPERGDRWVPSGVISARTGVVSGVEWVGFHGDDDA